LILFLGSFLVAQNNKINIAVLDLDATNINEKDARFLSDRLRIELFDAGTFNVLERDKMNVILDEQGFQLSGCTSVECAVEIGQLLNVQQIVAGNIGRIGNVYSITLRLISVKTGKLMQTAKHDYQGELSEMLTEVLPEIAQELSMVEKTQQEMVEIPKKKGKDRWGFQVKIGRSSSALITDFNKNIDEFNATFQPDLDNLNQFNSFALVVVWDYDESWRFNFGFQASGMTGDWKYEIDDYTAMSGVTYDRLEFERSFSFSYLYADVDYKIQILKNLNFYLGAGLGINSLNSMVKQDYQPESDTDNSSKENEFDYVVLAIRLKAGFDYAISNHITLLLELCPIIQTEYDTIDEYQDSDVYRDFRDVIYPETMNGTMSTFALGITYFF